MAGRAATSAPASRTESSRLAESGSQVRQRFQRIGGDAAVDDLRAVFDRLGPRRNRGSGGTNSSTESPSTEALSDPAGVAIENRSAAVDFRDNPHAGRLNQLQTR